MALKRLSYLSVLFASLFVIAFVYWSSGVSADAVSAGSSSITHETTSKSYKQSSFKVNFYSVNPRDHSKKSLMGSQTVNTNWSPSGTTSGDAVANSNTVSCSTSGSTMSISDSSVNTFTAADYHDLLGNENSYQYFFLPVKIKLPAGMKYIGKGKDIGGQKVTLIDGDGYDDLDYAFALNFDYDANPNTLFTASDSDKWVDINLLLNIRGIGMCTYKLGDNDYGRFVNSSMDIYFVPESSTAVFDPSVPNADSVAVKGYFGETITPPQFNRPGYQFKGWNPAVGNFKVSQTNYKASWEPNQYVVKFAHNDETSGDLPSDMTVRYEQGATAPLQDKSLVVTNKLFVGWSTDKTAAEDESGNASLYEPGDKIDKLTTKNNDTVILYPVFLDKDATKLYNVPSTLNHEFQDKASFTFKLKFASAGRIVKFEKLVGKEWKQVDIRRCTGSEKDFTFALPEDNVDMTYRVVVRSTEGSKPVAANVKTVTLVRDIYVMADEDEDFEYADGNSVINLGSGMFRKIGSEDFVFNAKSYTVGRAKKKGKNMQLPFTVKPAYKQTVSIWYGKEKLDSAAIKEGKKAKFKLDVPISKLSYKFRKFTYKTTYKKNDEDCTRVIGSVKLAKKKNPKFAMIGDSRTAGIASGASGANTWNKTSKSGAAKAFARAIGKKGIKTKNITYHGVTSSGSADWFKRSGEMKDKISKKGSINGKKVKKRLQKLNDIKDGASGVILWLGYNECKKFSATSKHYYIPGIKKIHKKYPNLRIYVFAVQKSKTYRKYIPGYNKALKKALKKKKYVDYFNLNKSVKGLKSEDGMHFIAESNAKITKAMGQKITKAIDWRIQSE